MEFGYLTPVLEIKIIGYRVEGEGGEGGILDHGRAIAIDISVSVFILLY